MSKRIEPATKWLLVVKSDTVDIRSDVRSLYVTGDGNLVLMDINGNTETFPVVTGQVLPCQPTRVLATGSTATCIALY